MGAKKYRYCRRESYGPQNAMRDISDMSRMAMVGTVGIGMIGMTGSVVSGLVKK